MGRNLRGAVAAAVVTALAVSTGAGAALSPEYRARKAVRYIVTQQEADGSIPAFSALASTADAIVSMVAAKRAPSAIDEAVRYLRNNLEGADRVGEKAKVVMALVAAQRSPRSFGGRNLVREIRDGREADGSYGDLAQSEVFDQTLAILALIAADAPVPHSTYEWLASAQCGDGGWQFDQPAGSNDDTHCFDSSAPTDFNKSDTNTTALAVMAFAARPIFPPVLFSDPFAFIETARDPHFGGWVFDPSNICKSPNEAGFCFRTDANSTSLVLQAYAAADREPPSGGRRALRRLQLSFCGKNAGAFAYSYALEDGQVRKGSADVGATIAAVLGLLERSLPVAGAAVTKPAPPKACE